MKYTITTLVSDDMFKYYIPLFVYSARRACPDADIKIFLRGKLDDDMKRLCGPYVIENTFTNYPTNGYTTNALRFLVDQNHFRTKYIYFTDIDFIMLPHLPSLYEYQKSLLKKTKQEYAGHRGPRRVKLADGTFIKDGKNTRIAAGAFFCTISLLDKFNKKKALSRIMEGKCDFRCYDEVMLGNLLRNAGQKLPETKGTYLNGKTYDIRYRDVHLGDFKFTKRWKNTARMQKKFLPLVNIMEYQKLLAEPEWQEVVEFCCSKDRHIAMYFKALNKHIKNRGL